MLRSIAICLLLAGCVTTGATSCNPPARFDFEPKHYYVRSVSPTDFGLICSHLGQGCTIGPTIYLRNDLSKEWRKCVLRHEKGHINGWPGHHPP